MARWWQRLFLALGIVQSVAMQSMANEAPKEVARLTEAVKAIPGITDVELGKVYLPDVAISDLSLPGAYADLPAAALRRTKGALATIRPAKPLSLRRTKGALPDELLLSIGFSIERDEKGLKALEFLAWWTRDQARGGENMQLRALALPPMAGNTKQLGQTLRFTIDWFYSNPSQDIGVVMKALDETAASLELATHLYRPAFQ